MSRYELQELERLIRLEEEGIVEEEPIPEGIPEFDENGEQVSKEFIAKQTDEFKDLKRQVIQIQPMRIAIFKRYWNKFKYNKKRREMLIEMFDEADEQV